MSLSLFQSSGHTRHFLNLSKIFLSVFVMGSLVNVSIQTQPTLSTKYISINTELYFSAYEQLTRKYIHTTIEIKKYI